MKTPHPIPYQGSKRHIAKYILPFFPHEIDTLIEPFAGSAAISIAAACYGKASRFHLNDLNKPLMALWREIIDDPQGIAKSYERLWTEQQGHEREYYDQVRDKLCVSSGRMVGRKHREVLEQILSGRSDANVRFSDLTGLLHHLAFSERVRGDHHIFWKEGVAEIINLQPKGSKAKPYQVRQVRGILLRYKLGVADE